MLIQHTKKIIFVVLILSLLGGVWMKAMADKTGNDPELPIRKMQVTLDENQNEKFFDQLRKFSEKHGFAIRIAPTTPSGKDFSIQMWREDFKIFGDNPFNHGVFKFGIYENNSSAKHIAHSYLDDMVVDFSIHVSEVPTAIFSDKN